jgi:hypothetical protein
MGGVAQRAIQATGRVSQSGRMRQQWVPGLALPWQAHRLFVWSADVFAESQDSPWSKPPSWSGEAARAAVEFIVGQKGPSDTLLVCDGRSRAVRRELETIMEAARYVTEIWVVYAPHAAPRAPGQLLFRQQGGLAFEQLRFPHLHPGEGARHVHWGRRDIDPCH